MLDTITLTEDYCLSIDKPLYALVEEKTKEGFREVYRYQHPAVGLVVVMEQDYSLVDEPI
jgi:hypothetical protein